MPLFGSKSFMVETIAQLGDLFRPTSGLPEILYHYTTARGLHDILASRSLWTTHYDYLNDPSEVRQLTTATRAAFAGTPDKIRALGSKSRPTTPEEFRASLVQMLDHHDDLSGHYASYVASFSGSPNILSQWRSYAANGAGYSIGFKTAALASMKSATDMEPALYRVSYDESEHTAAGRLIVDRVVDRIVERFDIHTDDESRMAIVGQALHCLAGLFAAAGPLCKNAAYSEEHEYRLVLSAFEPGNTLDRLWHDDGPTIDPGLLHTRLRGFRVRQTGGQLIPYTAVQFPDGPLQDVVTKIVVGPTCPQRRNTDPLRLHLHNAGATAEIPIQLSAIPAR